MDLIKLLNEPRAGVTVLRARYALECAISSPGSITGHHIEQAELGLPCRPADGGRINSQESVRAELADLTLLCRDLSQVEQDCCRLRWGQTAGSAGYTSVRRLCDLRDGDGEEIVDVRPRDAEGRPMDSYVAVRGRRSLFLPFQEIGEKLGLSAGQVRGIIARACSKVEVAIRWRAFGQAIDSRYE